MRAGVGLLIKYYRFAGEVLFFFPSAPFSATCGLLSTLIFGNCYHVMGTLFGEFVENLEAVRPQSHQEQKNYITNTTPLKITNAQWTEPING